MGYGTSKSQKNGYEHFLFIYCQQKTVFFCRSNAFYNTSSCLLIHAGTNSYAVIYVLRCKQFQPIIDQGDNYILSETQMLRNGYFHFFFKIIVCLFTKTNVLFFGPLGPILIGFGIFLVKISHQKFRSSFLVKNQWSLGTY